MAKVVLYQYAGWKDCDSISPFCTKVHRILGYKKIPYEISNLTTPGEIQKVNPGVGKLPVLEWDGERIADSSRIATFLEEQQPEPQLLPEDADTLAQAWLLEDWADESLYWFAVYERWLVDENFQPFAAFAFAKVPAPARPLVKQIARRQVRGQLRGQGLGRLAREQVHGMLEGHLRALDARLAARPYLAGDSLTIADIAVFAPLHILRSETLPATPDLLSTHAKVTDWLDRVDTATKPAT